MSDEAGPTASADPAPPGGSDPDAVSGVRGWPRWVVVSAVLGVVCVALAALVVVFALTRPSNAFSVAEKEVAPLAAHDAVNFTSFDYRNLDAQFALVKSESSGSFLADFKKEEAGIRTRFTTERLTSQGIVRSWAVGQVRPHQVDVLIALDDQLSPTGSAPQTVRYRLDVQMTETNGRWLVTNASPIV